MSTNKESEFEPSAPPIESSSGIENPKLIAQQSVDLEASAPFLEVPPFSIPFTQVEISLSASSLLNLDQITHSDPLCVIFLLDSTTLGEWHEIGRTEAIRNDLNPEWKTKFLIDYRFEEKQLMTFMVYDKDCTKCSLENHDFLGKLECSLGEIVSAPHSKFTRPLKLPTIHNTQNRDSSITIISEELKDCKKFITLQLSLTALNERGTFPTGKIFVNVSKQIRDGSWNLLDRADTWTMAESEAKLNACIFSTAKLRYSSVCNIGNLETPLRFQIQQIKQSFRGKSSKLVGEILTNYIEITEKCTQGMTARFPLGSVRDNQNLSKEDSGLGVLEISNYKCEVQKSFMDYLQEGIEINFAVGIDFTSSNGVPTHHTSLHYKHGKRDNPYVMTLKILGDILQDYSTTKMFYAYGFGAKGFPLSNRVNHKFPLNFKESNPQCDGIGGILRCYSRVLQRIKLYGPTCFAPLIREVTEIAKASIGASSVEKYFVLVILTDGIVCDPETTKKALVEASTAPMSVIIVGIGDEDFTVMEKLDSDDKLLRSKCNQQAKRDIVQFVELRKYVNFKSISPITEGSKVALSRAVLAELPQQVVSWMNLYRT